VTVTEAVAAYEKEGYVTPFGVEEGGRVRCGACRTVSDAAEVKVEAMARVEGASNPDDMAAVAVVRCPWCTVAGVVVLGYGPMASPEDSDVLLRLSDERTEGQPAVLLGDDPPA
jgi:hypothetical protein